MATTDSTLKITILDVGQGDGILIECPNNQIMLVDLGSRQGRPEAQMRAAEHLSETSPPELKTSDWIMLEFKQNLQIPIKCHNVRGAPWPQHKFATIWGSMFVERRRHNINLQGVKPS